MPVRPKFNEQKAAEAASILLNLKGGRTDYLWLIKMLYFIDREAFFRWERPITYDNYVSMNFGPVLSTVLNLIKKKIVGRVWKNYILTISRQYEVTLNGSPPSIRKLSPAEVGLIQEIFAVYGENTGFQLAKMSHNFPEWRNPKGSVEPIEVQDLLQGLSYSSEDIERIINELQEEAAVDDLFGA